MNIPAIIRSVGWSGTEWAWFALILAASAIFVPYWPDAGVVKFFFIYLLAAFAAVQVVRFRGFDLLDGLIAATVIYAASSVLWAVDPWGAGGAAIKWVAFGLIIIAARRLPSDTPILAAVAAAALAALAAQLLLPVYFAGFGNENFATWWFVAAFPFLIAGFVEWPRVLSVIIVSVAGYVVFFNGAHIEAVPIAVWFAYGAVSPGKRPRKLFLAIGAVICAGVLFGIEPSSIDNRLQLWQAAFSIWWANPVFGSGLGGFDTLFSAYAPAGQSITNSDVTAAGAAHNDVLQVASDLGVIGAALAATALWTALKRRSGANWPVWALIGIAALSFVDFPLQNPAVALLAALAVARLTVKKPGRLRRFRSTFLAAPVCVALVTAGGFALISQIYFAKVAAAYQTNVIAAHLNNEWAVYYWPFDKHARRELLFTALNSGVDDTAVQRAIAAARSAYVDNPRIERLIALYRKER